MGREDNLELQMVLFETIITIRGGVDDLFQVISFNIYELSNSAHQILRICWLLDARGK